MLHTSLRLRATHAGLGASVVVSVLAAACGSGPSAAPQSSERDPKVESRDWSDDFPCATATNHPRRVVGYLRTDVDLPWIENGPASEALVLAGLTHVNLAFAVPNYDPKTSAYLGVSFLDTEETSTRAKNIKTLVSAAHRDGVKVLVSFMGAYHSSLPEHTRFLGEPAEEARVAQDLAGLVANYDLDGVDIDLESPVVNDRYAPFVTQVAQYLSAQFGEQQKLLTAAVAYWNRYEFPTETLRSYDFINVMSYDRPRGDGQEHSTMENVLEDVTHFACERGVASDKVVLGVPFYGLCYGTGCPAYTPSDRSLSYAQIHAEHPEASESDKLSSANYWFTYNGPKTIRDKSEFAARDLGGVMVWALKHDDGTLFPALLEGRAHQ